MQHHGPDTCSLRDAIRFANTRPSGDTTTITVPAGTFFLSRTGAGEDDALTGDLDVKANVTITGAGVGATIIDGDGLAAPMAADRIFQIFPGYQVTVSGLTLQNGLQYWDAVGGAIRNAGNLTLMNITFAGNMADGQRDGTRDIIFTSNLPAFGGALFNDPGGSVTIASVIFTGNTAQGGFGTYTGPHSDGPGYGGAGGAIANEGTMTVSISAFSANTAAGGGGGYSTTGADTNGGAILNTGTLTITTSAFTSNTSTAVAGVSGGLGTGGAITTTGALTVTRSTFASNSTVGGRGSDTTNTYYGIAPAGSGGDGIGGAILINSGAATILANDTFVSNSATGGIGGNGCGRVAPCPGDGGGGGGYGGALFDLAGTVNMGNVTLSGNAATGAVGGSTNGPGGPTMGLPGGAAGGAVNNNNSAPLKLANTIVAANTVTPGGGTSAPNNCYGSITDLGNDLEYNPTTTCGFANAAQHGDPQLGPLANNGGPTQTMALGGSSAALSTGSASICSAPYVSGIDQRGMPRPAGVCSIGAYEPQVAALPPPKPTMPTGTPPNPIPSPRPPGQPGGPTPNPLPPHR